MMTAIGLFGLCLIMLLQTVIHEGAHALAAKLFGAEITEFKPWPHRYKKRFYWGRMAYIGRMSARSHALITAAPMLWNLAAMTIAVLAPINQIVAIALLAANAIDLSVNVFSRNPSSDFRKVLRHLRR